MSNKVVNFQQWISTQALGEKIPFSVIGSIPKRWAKVEKVELAGMAFPKLNTLLTREVWFREFIGRSLGNKRVELQVGIYALAKKLREYAPTIITSDTIAVKELSSLLTGQSVEDKSVQADVKPVQDENELVVLEDETVQAEMVIETKEDTLNSFFMSHLNDFQALLNLIQSMADETMSQMLQVTFFVASRADASWDFSDTATLLPDELDEIKSFMTLEMNGGVVQAEENTLVQAEEPPLGEELAA